MRTLSHNQVHSTQKYTAIVATSYSDEHVHHPLAQTNSSHEFPFLSRLSSSIVRSTHPVSSLSLPIHAMAPTSASTTKKTHPAVAIAAKKTKSANAVEETPMRKVRRSRPGSKAMQKIRQYSNSKKRIIQYRPFAESVKKFLASDNVMKSARDTPFQRQAEAVELLLWATQEVGAEIFGSAQTNALVQGGKVAKEKHVITVLLNDPLFRKMVFADERLRAMVYSQEPPTNGVYV